MHIPNLSNKCFPYSYIRDNFVIQLLDVISPFLQRFQPALSQEHPSATPSRSRCWMSWTGAATGSYLPPSPLTWRWEQKMSPWASGPARVPLCFSTSARTTESTWLYCSTSMVSTQILHCISSPCWMKNTFYSLSIWPCKQALVSLQWVALNAPAWDLKCYYHDWDFNCHLMYHWLYPSGSPLGALLLLPCRPGLRGSALQKRLGTTALLIIRTNVFLHCVAWLWCFAERVIYRRSDNEVVSTQNVMPHVTKCVNWIKIALPRPYPYFWSALYQVVALRNGAIFTALQKK